MASMKTGIDHGFTKMMMDALSLPKNTRSFELRVAVDEVVSVKCEYFPEIETGKLETIFIKYDLVKKPEVADVTSLDSKAVTHIAKER